MLSIKALAKIMELRRWGVVQGVSGRWRIVQNNIGRLHIVTSNALACPKGDYATPWEAILELVAMHNRLVDREGLTFS